MWESTLCTAWAAPQPRGRGAEGEAEHTRKIRQLQSSVGGPQLPVPGSGLCFLKSLRFLLQYYLMRKGGCVNESKNISTAATERRIKMEVP